MLYRWNLIYCVGYAGSSGAGSPPWIELWCLYNLDALGLFIVISHVCRLNNRAVYSNDLCNSCYSLVIIKLQQPRGHSLTFWVNHVNLCICWSFLDGSWKISMLLLCKFSYLRIILLVPCVKSNWSESHALLLV